MTQDWRRRVPSWRVTDARPFRPRLALAAVAVLGVLLLEVWQNSTVASLSVQVGRATHALQQSSAELEWTRARLERSSNRAELNPVAASLGLRPVDPHQIVTLPEAYLEPADPRGPLATSAGLLALGGRAMQLLVPDAAARGRRVN